MDKDLKEQQREHFNKISQQYLEGKHDPKFLELQKLLWDDVFSLINDYKKRKLSILEPMCGFLEGYKLLNKFNFQFDYVGFDFSDEVVNKINIDFPELNVFHGDVTKYTTSKKFDLIILIGGLHHVPNDAKQVVQNLSSMLKKDGLFISFEPTHFNPLNKAIRDFIYQKNKIFEYETERGFHLNELKSFFKDAQLSEYSILYPGLLSYIMYYNPYAFPSLNSGSTWLVNKLYSIDKLFFRNIIGKFFSFATLSIWIKK